MRDVVIVEAVRAPQGRRGGMLSARSATLAQAEKSASAAPYQSGVPVPARQAYSHWASVGSVKRAPARRESQRQKAVACSQETRTTGWALPASERPGPSSP